MISEDLFRAMETVIEHGDLSAIDNIDELLHYLPAPQHQNQLLEFEYRGYDRRDHDARRNGLIRSMACIVKNDIHDHEELEKQERATADAKEKHDKARDFFGKFHGLQPYAFDDAIRDCPDGKCPIDHVKAKLAGPKYMSERSQLNFLVVHILSELGLKPTTANLKMVKEHLGIT